MPKTIVTLLALAACAIAGAAATPFGASAQPRSEPGTELQCGLRDFVLRRLQQNYREEPVALGITHNGGLIEVLATPRGTTWTIIITTPDRLMTCIVSSGENWRQMQPQPGEQSRLDGRWLNAAPAARASSGGI